MTFFGEHSIIGANCIERFHEEVVRHHVASVFKVPHCGPFGDEIFANLYQQLSGDNCKLGG